MNKNLIGIMQGRLSPPSDDKIQSFPKTTWQEEFFKAKDIGLSNIEWIFEFNEWERNPISYINGIKQIKELIRETGINIESVCADYFMDIPYLRVDSNTKKELSEKLEWLIVQSDKVEANYIDLPFVDASVINGKEEFLKVKEFVMPALKTAKELGIIIALETSLNPGGFKELLLFFNHPNLMANYDTGNSASMGYNCVEELASYGKWIKTIHIKDRVLHDGTVPLSTGNVDFPTFFKELSRIKYDGPLILQAAREGDEVQTAIKNKSFLQQCLDAVDN